VKAAIAINYEATDSEIEMTTKNARESGSIGGLPIGSLPWPERAVYFLRKILNYSRRDTALLLGLSDANVDQLHCIAEKRIGSSRRPFIASPEIVAKLPVHARAKHSAAFAAYE
jgi:Sigma-70, region 4